jgi:hypothetical protein
MGPVFEKCTRMRRIRLVTKVPTTNPDAILKMTRIEVHPASSTPKTQTSGFHDRFQEAKGPTFEVERQMSAKSDKTYCFGTL